MAKYAQRGAGEEAMAQCQSRAGTEGAEVGRLRSPAQWVDYGGRMSHIKCSRLCSPMNYYGAVAFDIYVL